MSQHLQAQIQAIVTAIQAWVAEIDGYTESMTPTRQDLSVRLLRSYRDALAARAA